jgi:hypothetical protein
MEIIRGSKIAPPRLGLYGPEKIGKTTWAASADTPLFVVTEDGADEVGPDRLPKCTSYEGVKKAIAFAVASDEHATVVVDNLSGLETLMHAAISKEYGVNSIEEVLKGYGKGIKIAEERWENEVFPLLDTARDAGKVVIVLAHAQVRRAEDPDAEPYDQYTIDLAKGAAAALCKWLDVIAFAAHAVKIESTDAGFNKKIRRATNVGNRRVLHLTGSPSHVAGNRYGLPASIPFEKEDGWQAFLEAMDKRTVRRSVAAVVKNGIEAAQK